MTASETDRGMNHTSHNSPIGEAVSGAVLDPVCGMTVNADASAGSYEYKGQTYYFCSTHCLHGFRDDPETFLNKSSEPKPSQPIGIWRESKSAGTPVAQTYTCPMHPQ